MSSGDIVDKPVRAVFQLPGITKGAFLKQLLRAHSQQESLSSALPGADGGLRQLLF